MTVNSFELNEQTISVIEEIGGHMPGGFFIYRAEEPEELIYANRSVFSIYGCADMEEFKELTGFTFKGMVHPDDYQKISESIAHQIDSSVDGMDQSFIPKAAGIKASINTFAAQNDLPFIFA